MMIFLFAKGTVALANARFRMFFCVRLQAGEAVFVGQCSFNLCSLSNVESGAVETGVAWLIAKSTGHSSGVDMASVTGGRKLDAVC